jgi:riboflavin synthase
MFTGIVTDVGEVTAVEERAAGLRHRLKISCRYDRATIVDGASIACNGVCMTVVDAGVAGNRTWFAVDAAAETLKVTTVGQWGEGTRVNLERALRVGDELGGHIVAAHADGIAQIVSRQDMPEMARFVVRAPLPLARFIASKGSVALDGVSLTINEVVGEAFSVLVIPHTLAVTTLGAWRVGTDVNLEVDLMARYAARLLGEAGGAETPSLS